jgi:hypothetical protein
LEKGQHPITAGQAIRICKKNKVQTSDNKKMHDLREEYGNQMDYERI